MSDKSLTILQYMTVFNAIFINLIDSLTFWTNFQKMGSKG